MDGLLDFFGGTLTIVVAALAILAIGAVLRLIVGVLRLPSATRYWWVAAAIILACILARAAGNDELGDLLFIPLMIYILWLIGTVGISERDLDQEEIFQGPDRDDDGGDAGG